MANKANNDEVVTWRNGKKLNEENRLDHLLFKKKSLENKKTNIELLIEKLGIEKYAKELDEEGYTVVPPSVTGVSEEMVDELIKGLLEKSEELIPGTKFSLDMKGNDVLDYGKFEGFIERMSGAKPAQFQLVQLCTYKSRAFRDLAINPVATALIQHMVGYGEARFSSHNAFVKWRGEGYGDSLGLHVDQGAVPYPWGKQAYNANCNWVLTDYTRDAGPLAVVPKSHLLRKHPTFPDAIEQAIPVLCPKGSLVIFHGATWHGAYPRKDEGLRLVS